MNTRLCECGCGIPTRISTKTDPSKKWIKGQPRRFLKGHNAKVMSWAGKPQARNKERCAKTFVARFWAKIEKCENGCWEWTGVRNWMGYGRVSRAGRITSAHRIAYELSVAAIPDGLSVLHRCDNPPCCNPDHLFVGTVRDNAKDAVAKGRYVVWRWLTEEQKAAIRAARGIVAHERPRSQQGAV